MRTLLAAACVLLLAASLSWGAVFDLGLFGWDTYPLIVASRVDSLADVFGTFGEELMGGRFMGGHYYRPLVHLSFALDHALYGVAPAGYHATDFGLLVTGALATFALARRLVGPGLGAWLAAFVFLLHPAHFDVLPVPPRRADSLAVVFTLLALATHAGGRSRGRSLVVGLCALGALASKETGVVAPVLVCFLALLESTPGQRLREALARAWPVLVALGLWAIARTLVLGGLGGSARGELTGAFTNAGLVLSRYTELGLIAGPLAGAALILAFALLARAEPPREARSFGSLGVFLIVWISVLLLLVGTAGGLRPWYALAFLPPLALALGGVLDRALRCRIAALRLGGLIIVVTIVGVQWGARNATERWEDAQDSAHATDKVCRRFDEVVRAAVPGTRVDLVPNTERRSVLPPYALEAYAELVHPGLTVRVEAFAPDLDPAAAGEVLVVMIRP